MRTKIVLNVRIWEGPVTLPHQPSAFGVENLCVEEFEMPSVWAFKMFEDLTALAVVATEDDLSTYRSLVSVLGSGKVDPRNRNQYLFQGIEVLDLFTATSNVLGIWSTKARINCEKTAMRIQHAPTMDEDSTRNQIVVTAKSQACIVLTHLMLFQRALLVAMQSNHSIILTLQAHDLS